MARSGDRDRRHQRRRHHVQRGERRDGLQNGTELHWEGSLSKKFPSGISVGVVGYHYRQLGDDSGSGAVLGAFRSQASAIGGALGYDFVLGATPVSTSFRYFHEFDGKNRLKADSALLQVSIPLPVGR